MASSWMLRRVALVRTDVSEELSASIIRVTRIGELYMTGDAILQHEPSLIHFFFAKILDTTESAKMT
jgi:hypothetical protein